MADDIVERLREALPALKGWMLNRAEPGEDEGTAIVGGSHDDGDFAPVATVDTGLYYQDAHALPLAEAIAAAVTAAPALLAEIERLRAEAANLRTVMVAAADEIASHWDAHCDAEGYGPANLQRRLEEGIPSEYGYTAGAFAKLKAETEELRAALAAQKAPLAEPTQDRRRNSGTKGKTMYLKTNEPRELASVLRGMTECGAAPADLWTHDQPDGDPFIARAAELLEEQEAQIELLARFVDQFGAQIAKEKAGAFLQAPASGRAAHSVSDEKGNDPQSTRHSSAPAAPAGWRPTETQIVAAARALNKRHAELCNVNEADSWMIQGDDFRQDALAALLAAAPTHTESAAPGAPQGDA